MNSPKLALVMMVKNEAKRILTTLKSVKDTVDMFIILDTGSEDNTVDIIRDYTSENKIPLYLTVKEVPHPFHFSNARNLLLDYADSIVPPSTYLLMLDCNDELRNGNGLLQFIQNYKGESTGFHVQQEWWNGTSLDKYFNIRLIKSNCGWRYKGAIHEYISSESDSSQSRIMGFTIYQDRTKDDNKSFKRFFKDEEILDKEYQDGLQFIKEGKIKTQDPRTVFYYGQTCMCIGKNEKAYRLYKERSELEGFTEERYHAYYRCGELSRKLNHSWEESFIWYLKAYEYSSNSLGFPRAEPLFRIADYYKDKCSEISFMNIKRCCELKYPDNCILFVDKRIYDYMRWNLMSVVAIKLKEIDLGKYACYKAIKEERKQEDIKNLELYITDKEERDKIVTNILTGTPVQTPGIKNPEQTKDKLKKKLDELKNSRKHKDR